MLPLATLAFGGHLFHQHLPTPPEYVMANGNITALITRFAPAAETIIVQTADALVAKLIPATSSAETKASATATTNGLFECLFGLLSDYLAKSAATAKAAPAVTATTTTAEQATAAGLGGAPSLVPASPAVTQ